MIFGLVCFVYFVISAGNCQQQRRWSLRCPRLHRLFSVRIISRCFFLYLLKKLKNGKLLVKKCKEEIFAKVKHVSSLVTQVSWNKRNHLFHRQNAGCQIGATDFAEFPSRRFVCDSFTRGAAQHPMLKPIWGAHAMLPQPMHICRCVPHVQALVRFLLEMVWAESSFDPKGWDARLN